MSTKSTRQSTGNRHLILPDVQQKPGCSTEHLRWAGEYAVEMLPSTIVIIGDLWDMESLSSYDKGQKSFEGRRYWKDIEAGNEALDVFMKPIRKEIDRRVKGRRARWNPRLVFTTGNHEYRIDRAVEKQAELETMLTRDHFNLEEHGFEVHDYLEPVIIDGVAYSHYFTSGVMGRPVSSARTLLTKKMMSCVMGHVQTRDIAYSTDAAGRRRTAIHVGGYYLHDEGYLTREANDATWRGLWVLHEVDDGQFDEMPVSIRYLEQKYG
jgi:hypothetical protein